MRLNQIDLNLFVVFEALYRERSVTRVAARLSLSQPAVSNALNRMRQTFDDPLFVRTPAGMAPTPVAESMIADIQGALSMLSRSVDATVHFDPSAADREYRLSFMSLAETLVLPGLLNRIGQLAPAIGLSNFYTDREAAVEDLKSGNTDILLDAPLLSNREIQSQRMARFRHVLAVRPGHPLVGSEVDLDIYLRCKHVHVSGRRKGRGLVDIALHKMGIQRDIVMRLQSFAVAEQVVKRSDVLWSVPEAMVKDSQLAVLELPFEVEPLQWNLFWHRSAENDPANQWLREQIAAEIDALSGATGRLN